MTTTIEVASTDAEVLEDIRVLLHEYPRLLTVEQAAAALNTTRRVIADATRRGEIKAVKIGRSWQYPQAALVAWIATLMGASHSQTSGSTAAVEPDASFNSGRSSRAQKRQEGKAA